MILIKCLTGTYEWKRDDSDLCKIMLAAVAMLFAGLFGLCGIIRRHALMTSLVNIFWSKLMLHHRNYYYNSILYFLLFWQSINIHLAFMVTLQRLRLRPEYEPSLLRLFLISLNYFRVILEWTIFLIQVKYTENHLIIILIKAVLHFLRSHTFWYPSPLSLSLWSTPLVIVHHVGRPMAN